MRSRLLLLPAMLLLLATACGDDDGSVFTSTTGGSATTAPPTTGATTAPPTTGATTAAPSTTSGGTVPGSAEELIDALTAELAAAGTPFDENAARCFAEGLVDEVGFERLVSLGAGNPATDAEDVFAQMSEGEVDAIAEVGLGCLDVHAMFVDQFVSQGMPQEAAVCIADGVAGAPFLHDMVVASMLGEEVDVMTDPEAMTLIMDLVTICLGE